MPQRLTLICHGASAATKAAAFPLDEPLTARAAAEAAAAGPLPRRADRAFTSPALRARQTAEALALVARVDPALRDLDHGRWGGRTLEEAQRAEPEAVRAWLLDHDAAPHGGESLADLRRRVSAWVDERLPDGGHTVIVTHSAVIRAAVLHVLEAPLRSFWRIDVEPLSLTDIRGDGARWTLRAIGRAIPGAGRAAGAG